MRIILIYTYVPAVPLAIDHRKGIVSTAELALQQQVSSLYTDHHGWLRGLLRRKLAMPSMRPTWRTMCICT